MKILFHSNQLGLRGTEVFMYNLALGCKNLGWDCHIAARKDKTQDSLDKFQAQFPVTLYNNFQEVEEIIKDENIDWLYAIKGGKKDGVISTQCKNFIHACFQRYEPHGDRYAFISEWLARACGQNKDEDFLPLIVTLPDHKEDMREELGIPHDAVVFGRHGGPEEFNIPFVREAIKASLEARKNIYFLFLGTNKFIDHPRVIHIDKGWDEVRVRKFINTCDYMLHARVNGESFGIAIGQFLYCNKPVITWADGIDKNHLAMCGNKGLYYRNGIEIYNILTLIWKKQPGVLSDVTDRVSEYTTEKIVAKFKRLIS